MYMQGILRYYTCFLPLQLCVVRLRIRRSIRSWSNKMADTANAECNRWFWSIYLLCVITGLVLLYAALLTICTCFLCRQLRWYTRNFGREPPVPHRRRSACCPSLRRVCAVEVVCCCLGCNVALPSEQNPRSEGESGSILPGGASTDTRRVQYGSTDYVLYVVVYHVASHMCVRAWMDGMDW